MTLISKNILTTSVACLLWLAMPAGAEQLDFQRQDNADKIQLSYRWTDFQNQEQSLSFELDKQVIHQQFQKLKSYQPHIAQRSVMLAMQKAARDIDPKQARIAIRKVGQELQYQVRASNPELISEWQSRLFNLERQAFDDYLASNYYARYADYLGQQGVKPDHIRYANESIVTLLPAANAIYAKLMDDSQPRAYVNILLSWIQAIPYDTLESRLTSNGSGFLPPASVLINNHGDCDSKTTLAVSLLRSMLPNMSMVILYLPGHALMGVKLSHREKDATVTIEGSDYLLVEPTGPAPYQVGEASPTSLAAIAGNMFTYEKVTGIPQAASGE
ncbi:hypothetical protein [Bowmanella denitrificans]|uniref:hypothetical protein n=1 Tax=Bowmanella denitrificans TaxID=366582 RepID=UPI000C9BE74F|nr:hypothetical protein [Bowmanella denitrificans]